MARQGLSGSITLKKDGSGFYRKFNISRIIDMGASVICYEATSEDAARGILKEFFPRGAGCICRDDSGRLVLERKGDVDAFGEAVKEYTGSYEMLKEKKLSPDNSDLATFIPYFEIYRSCDGGGGGAETAYIWTPGAGLETFAGICEEIHKNPQENPENKLLIILRAIETLTDCVCALHASGMIHRDIKPSNFGFVKRADKTLTETLSLFDIDSVCSVYDIPDGIVGTDGFMEPEAGLFMPDVRTDIYSIGATLYYAIVNSDVTKESDFLYNPDRYDSIDDDIDSSLLIQASGSNSHPLLRNALSVILKKCLSPRADRYKNCDALKEDIAQALYYAPSYNAVQKTGSRNKWVLTDKPSALLKESIDSSLAMLCHLYENPLYAAAPRDGDELNVVIIGFGSYSQQFLNFCLQAGQMKGKVLDVSVFPDVPGDKEPYLAKRPALGDFFNIDGKNPSPTSYGSINFYDSLLTAQEDEDGKKHPEAVIYDYCREKNQPPHYIFIALGDDDLNMNTACLCREAIGEGLCSISFVCEGERRIKSLPEGVKAVYVTEDAEKHGVYPELERMAFNAHLVWQNHLNISLGDIKKEFHAPYNHSSCLGYVLALRYKLYSIGIDVENNDARKQAQLFKSFLSDKSNRSARDELIWLEHRRWVTEKICLGWTGISDIEYCATGSTKDERHKRHLCIAKSRPDRMLAQGFTQNGNYDKWDNATADELAALDELDRISVSLHRMYKKRADIARKKNILNGNTVSEIRLLINGDKKAFTAFQELYSYMKDIWNGDGRKVAVYKSLKKAFRDSLSGLSPESRKSAIGQINALDAMFFPVMASMEYRDFKREDVDLVDNIPFILTYSESVYLVVPYSTADNTGEFSNVAAATVINPARIIFLSYIEDKNGLDEVKKSLSYMAEYMNKKNLRASVDFVLVHPASADGIFHRDIAVEFRAESSGRVRQVKLIPCERKSEIKEKVSEYLNRRRAGKHIFAAELKKAPITDILETAGFFEETECYSFDMNTRRFKSVNGCEELTYIKKEPYLSVNDMIAFEKSSSESSNQPEFFRDYKELWKKYCENGVAITWKLMCEQLEKHSSRSAVMARFSKKQEPGAVTESLRYIIPRLISPVVSNLLDFLKAHRAVGADSGIGGYSSDTCEVIIKDKAGNKKQFDILLSQPHLLTIPDMISFYLDPKAHDICVCHNSLIVKNFTPTGNRAQSIAELIAFFSERSFITNLTSDASGISFTFASKEIKELMTTGGKLLEVYVYHKIKETPGFDDAVSSFEVNMENTEVTSEFDAIVTKGFKALFIECKATPEIKQEYYYKLAGLARKYGINATAVLIADTREYPGSDIAALNEIQRKRGDMLGVITIYKPDEISNIGHTLMKILNGKYNTDGKGSNQK